MATGQSNQQLQDDPLAALRRAREEFDQRQEAERGGDDPLEALKDARARFDAQSDIPDREAPQPPEPGFIQRVTSTFRERGPFLPVRDFIDRRRAESQERRDVAEAETGVRPGGFRVPEGKMRDPFDPGRSLLGIGPRLPPSLVDIPKEDEPSALGGPTLAEALGRNQAFESIDAPQAPERRVRGPESPEQKIAREDREFELQVERELFTGERRGVASDQPFVPSEEIVPGRGTLLELAKAGVDLAKRGAVTAVGKVKEFGLGTAEGLRRGTAAEEQRRIDEGTDFVEEFVSNRAAEADAAAARETSMEASAAPPRPARFRRARGAEEVSAALSRALERDHAALQERYDSFPLPVRMAHAAVRGAFNAPALGRIDELVAKANGVVSAAFGLDAPALTTAEVFEIVERGLLDKGAGGAGFLVGAGVTFGATNRLVASFAPFTRSGTTARTILESFDPNNPVSGGVRALQGAVEGVPFDLAFKADTPRERMINLGAGLVIGAWLGPIVGGAIRRAGDLDPRIFDPTTAIGAVRAGPDVLIPTRTRRVPLAQQPLRQVLEEETARLEAGAARIKAADAPPPRELEAPVEQPGPGHIGPETVDPELRGRRVSEREGSPGRRVEDLEPNRIDELDPPPDPDQLTPQERITGRRNPSRDIDERTGLLNESAWERALIRVQGPKDADGRLIDPSGSADPNTEVLLFDLTRFKAINDLISMEAGNAKLREIADLIRDHSGISNRQIFRAGGDEFGIIVPTGTGQAIGRRIQKIVGETPIGDTEFLFSVRFGVGQSDVLANRAMSSAKKVETTPRFRGEGGEPLTRPSARQSDVAHTRTTADRFNPEVQVRERPGPEGPAGSPKVRPRDAADPPPPEVPVGRQADDEGGFFPLEEGASAARGTTVSELTVAELGKEAGGVDPRAIAKGVRAVKGFFRRHFTSAGDLPQHIFRLKLKADQWVQAQMGEVKFMLRRYDDTLRDLYGGDGPSQEIKDQINQALRGQLDPDEVLDPLLAPIVKRLREHVDSFSSQMMESGMVKGKLVPVIADNMGVYLSRSYRVFDDPNWAHKVPKDVRNRAENLIRLERPNATEEEIQGIIEGILSKENTSPLAFLGGGSVASKDLSMLIKRKDIHPSIRALMGEHTDVRLNYARSVERMANTLANHEFLTEVARTSVGTPGRAGGFFFQNREVRGDQRFITEFAASGSETMAPMNGLFTTPEIHKAFETAFGRQAQAPGWLNAYMKVNGIVKFDKTVLSLMTHVRNVLGNVGFAVANGHWRMQHLGRALEAANAGLGATQAGRRLRSKVLSPIGLGGKVVKELTPEQIARQERRLRVQGTGAQRGTLLSPWERYYQNLQALGVVDQSAHAGELQAIIRDAARSGLDNVEPDSNLLSRAIKTGLEVTGALYRAEDDLWKVIAFENEFARYRKAMPNASQSEVEETAAWIVRNTYPTYSMVPSGVRAFRRNIAVGSFTSFPAEVFRTMYHTISIALSEVRSPNAGIRKIGAERMAGIAVATTLVPAAVSASRFFVGVDKQQDQDLRHFVAPWQQNSSFIYLSKGEDSTFDYVDISYTDPHSYARDAIMAALTGDGDWGEKLLLATLQATQPFLGEEILFGKMLDWRRNSTPSGRTVFNPEDSLPDQATDIFAHFYDALEPGTLTSARRVARGARGETSPTGRVFNVEREIKAVLTGSRRQTTSVPQSLMFRARSTQTRIRNANSILTRTANRRGTVSEEELTADFWDSLRSREKVFAESHEMAQAAIRLGMTQVQVERALRSENISRADARAIVEGTGPPRRRTDAGNAERNAILRALEREAEERR